MKTAPPTILSSGGKSLITKAFVLIVPFLYQINTIFRLDLYKSILKFFIKALKFYQSIFQIRLKNLTKINFIALLGFA